MMRHSHAVACAGAWSPGETAVETVATREASSHSTSSRSSTAWGTEVRMRLHASATAIRRSSTASYGTSSRPATVAATVRTMAIKDGEAGTVSEIMVGSGRTVASCTLASSDGSRRVADRTPEEAFDGSRVRTSYPAGLDDTLRG